MEIKKFNIPLASPSARAPVFNCKKFIILNTFYIIFNKIFNLFCFTSNFFFYIYIN